MNKRFRTLLIPILTLFGLCLTLLAFTATNAGHLELTDSHVHQDILPQQILPGLSPPLTKMDQGIKLIESDDHGLILELQTPKFQVEQVQSDSEPCQVLIVDGYAETDTPGLPRLPVKGTMVGIPYPSTPTLSILDSNLILLPEQYNLCPVESPVFNINIDGEIHSQGFQMDRDPQAYSNNRLSPESLVELVSTSFLRSQRVGQLRFQPFQYNPVTGELRYYNRIRLRLDYSVGQTPIEPLGLTVDEGAFETLLNARSGQNI